LTDYSITECIVNISIFIKSSSRTKHHHHHHHHHRKKKKETPREKRKIVSFLIFNSVAIKSTDGKVIEYDKTE